MSKNKPLIKVEDLHTYFYEEDKFVKAVNGVSFELYPREILGIVGQSGSGKSVTALSIIGIPGGYPGVVKGHIYFEDKDILKDLPEYCSIVERNSKLKIKKNILKWDSHIKKIMKPYRGRFISMIFQEPLSSLDPFFKVREIFKETLKRNSNITSKDKIIEKSKEVLKYVGLDFEEVWNAYPAQLSGGMCQRVMIANVLLANPKVLIADEPTSYLDPLIQYNILELLNNLVEEKGLSIILITHDIQIILKYAHRIIVIYKGYVMECISRDLINKLPYYKLHPYTRQLMGEKLLEKYYTLKINREKLKRKSIKSKCPYFEECLFGNEDCVKMESSELKEIEEGHLVRCIRIE